MSAAERVDPEHQALDKSRDQPEAGSQGDGGTNFYRRLHPAPFCLLDEVDAPLDDNNVSRFCEIVQEMSARVQFMFITHNKVTMEMASQLMGVTMNEPGVSRLVTVDIDAAVQLAAS